MLCVFVLIGAMSLQVFASPYKDPTDDLCELLSLMSCLMMMLSGMVFKLVEEDSFLANLVSSMIVWVILANT